MCHTRITKPLHTFHKINEYRNVNSSSNDKIYTMQWPSQQISFVFGAHRSYLKNMNIYILFVIPIKDHTTCARIAWLLSKVKESVIWKYAYFHSLIIICIEPFRAIHLFCTNEMNSLYSSVLESSRQIIKAPESGTEWIVNKLCVRSMK